MARIRTIKPELLEDEKTASLSHPTWRLFVSVLLLADDYGNLRANPRLVSGAVFWAHDGLDVAGMLRELGDAGLMTFYSVNGQRYAHICGWEKHQRVDKPGKPLCPGPSEAEPTSENDDSPEVRSTDSRDSREALATLPRLTGTGTPTKEETGSPPPAQAPVRDPGAAAPAKVEPPARRVEPDSAHNLIHVLGVLVRDAHPGVGLWSPGRFAEKDAVLFYERIPKAELPRAVPTIRARLEAYVAMASEDGWTVKGFLDRFNELGLQRQGGAPRAPPRPVGHARAEDQRHEVIGDQKV